MAGVEWCFSTLLSLHTSCNSSRLAFLVFLGYVLRPLFSPWDFRFSVCRDWSVSSWSLFFLHGHSNFRNNTQNGKKGKRQHRNKKKHTQTRTHLQTLQLQMPLAPWAHPVIQNIYLFYLFPISKFNTKLQEHGKNRIILKIKSKSNKKNGESNLVLRQLWQNFNTQGFPSLGFLQVAGKSFFCRKKKYVILIRIPTHVIISLCRNHHISDWKTHTKIKTSESKRKRFWRVHKCVTLVWFWISFIG